MRADVRCACEPALLACAVRRLDRASVSTERESFLDDFRDLLATFHLADSPLLLVLDTFEEVQTRSATYTEEIWRFLNQLREAHSETPNGAVGPRKIPT